ncbi:unnamed protein product [Cuscuta campestris]|uniref:Uncharacterized protein n=1 Tax=Cuscuta campestris TaxID=132261 RepID=A0A484K573_9ASTE|nr:unnamed protein product [Cuscuta campestris]
MALCHCQITERGFADATDMVGPSIEALRPTSTQIALDAPSGFFTVHLASLKKELRFPLHSLLIEILNEVDFLPCQLVPNSHRYIAGYLVRCKEVRVKPTPDHFLFTFKLTKGHGDWASYASLSQRFRAPILPSRSLSPARRHPPFHHPATLRPGCVEIKRVVTEVSLAALGFEFVQDKHRHQPDLLRDAPGLPSRSLMLGGDLGGSSQRAFSERPPSPPVVTYEVAIEGRSTRFSIPPLSPSLGDVQLETLVTLPAQDRARISAGSEDDPNDMVFLKLSQATLGMIEIVGWRQDRQAAMDEAKKAAEDKQRELQEEVARHARELEEEKGRSATLEIENASLSSEVGSISASVAELEGEKTGLIQ